METCSSIPPDTARFMRPVSAAFLKRAVLVGFFLSFVVTIIHVSHSMMSTNLKLFYQQSENA